MLKNKARDKMFLLVLVAVLILLNLYTFAQAYPETFVVDSGCCSTRMLAKDFSAYYTAAWRELHDQPNVYTQGQVNDGQAPIYPEPEPFKYLPSFLFFVLPFLLLNYQQALIAFDIFQFLLLPLMAFLLYRLLREKSLLIIAVVMILAILQPSPTAHWGLSASYYWQWAEGQDKVLNTTLLLISFYLGQTRRPVFSGIALGLGAFDPRFFLLALPLFVFYNRSSLKISGLSLIASLALFNSPLLINRMGVGFLSMVFQRGAGTPLYYYAFIPLITLVSLIVANAKEIQLLATPFLRKYRRSKPQGKTAEKILV